MNEQHFLALADGEIFWGRSCGAATDSLGEVVFNTGATGYQEIISDPSYFGQFVVLSSAEIGNYGCNSEDWESDRLHLSGLIVQQMNRASNYRSSEELDAVLRRFNKPALAHIDTRRLVLHLRDRGTQKAFLHASDEPISPDEAIQKARNWEGLDGKDSAALVSCSDFWNPSDPDDRPEFYSNFESNQAKLAETSRSIPVANSGKGLKVVVYDFGVKWNILRSLASLGLDLTVVPSTTTAKDVLATRPDGVFLSNGPGDPAAVRGAIEAAKDLIGKIPIAGICLGHQILAIASGAKCERLKFGHHGCNHPVKNLIDGSIAITSQNHNFAVRPDSLPASIEVTHINLNDGTIEGIRRRDCPMFSVQYHPEAAPGPHDARNVLLNFLTIL